MTGNAGNALDLENPLCRHLLPLGDGLRRERAIGPGFLGKRSGEARIALEGPFGVLQGGCFHGFNCLSFAHSQLKAQLSIYCKYLFR